MGKTILFLSFIGIAFLCIGGALFPNSPAMWLASTSVNFAWLRLGMMLVLIALLITNPPRNIILRVIVGVFATALATWSLYATYTNQMKLLDSLSLLEVSVSTGLAVLEREMVIFSIREKMPKKPWFKHFSTPQYWVLNLR
jgi:hypothetical protein